ncbi:MAG: hypothetical protein ABEJ92_04050 [Halobacteriales archaeon]
MSEDDGPAGGEPAEPAPAATDGEVETYETDDGVVLYDAGNPLAWIESRTPVRLDNAA